MEMFETSVVRVRAQAAGGRLSLLTISVIAHSAVVIGAVAVSIASVDFPMTAPDEVSAAPFVFSISVPPPLGRPDGGATQQTPTPPRPQQPPPSNQITAPRQVPDEVRAVEGPDSGPITGDPNAASTEPIGDPLGDPNSVLPFDGRSSTITPIVEERIYQPHEVKAPVALYKPSPPYPQAFLKTKMRATVVIRCIIDKNGHVRDPQVIVPALPPFNRAVIDTVQTWRFTPGSHNGEAVESYLNLTVHFAVN
jgi:TonB family protein